MDLNSINEETFKKYKEFSDLNYEKFTSTYHYDEYYKSLKEAYEKIENLKKIDYNLTLNLLISISSFVFASLLIVCLGIPGIKDSIASDSLLFFLYTFSKYCLFPTLSFDSSFLNTQISKIQIITPTSAAVFPSVCAKKECSIFIFYISKHFLCYYC